MRAVRGLVAVIAPGQGLRLPDWLEELGWRIDSYGPGVLSAEPDRLTIYEVVVITSDRPADPLFNEPMLENLYYLNDEGVGVYAEWVRPDGDPKWWGYRATGSLEPTGPLRLAVDPYRLAATGPEAELLATALLDPQSPLRVGGSPKAGQPIAALVQAVGTRRSPAKGSGLSYTAPVALVVDPVRRVAYAPIPLLNWRGFPYRPTRAWRALWMALLERLSRPRKPPVTATEVETAGGPAEALVCPDEPVVQSHHHSPAPTGKPPSVVVGSSSVLEERPQRWAATVQRLNEWFHRSGVLPKADGSAGLWEAVFANQRRLRLALRPDCHLQAAYFFHLYRVWTERTAARPATAEAASSIAAPPSMATASPNAAGPEPVPVQVDARLSRGLVTFLLERPFQCLDPERPQFGLWSWTGPVPGARWERMQWWVDDNSWVAWLLLLLYLEQGEPTYVERACLTARRLLLMQREDGTLAHHLDGRAITRCPSADPYYGASPHFLAPVIVLFSTLYRLTGDPTYRDSAARALARLALQMPGFRSVYRVSRSEAWARTLGAAVMAAACGLPVGEPTPHSAGGEPPGNSSWLVQQAHAALSELVTEEGAILEVENPHGEVFAQDVGVFGAEGDRVADLLYTTNFAFFNWALAFRLLGDPGYGEAAARVGDFLARAQIEGDDPMMAGGWMRAFDLEAGEFHGSNQDLGWGPYVMETGWTHAPIGIGFLWLLLEDRPLLPGGVVPQVADVDARQARTIEKAAVRWA